MTHDIEMLTTSAEEQYDTLCRYVERELPSPSMAKTMERLRQDMNKLDLYLWTEEKAKRCLDAVNREGIVIEGIPQDIFPCVVADPGSVVVLSRYFVNHENNEVEVDFVLGVRFKTRHKTEGYRRDAFFTSSGIMTYDLTATTMRDWKGQAKCFVSAVYFIGEDKCFYHLPDHEEGPMRTDALTHVGAALEQMWYAYRPRTIVVKQETKATRRAKKKGPIPGIAQRAHQKEVHIVLDPDEVRIIKQRAVSKGSHASPVPHKRRPHKRVLKAARYKKARGKVIDIGEIHVNCEPGERIELPKKIFHVVSIGKIT